MASPARPYQTMISLTSFLFFALTFGDVTTEFEDIGSLPATGPFPVASGTFTVGGLITGGQEATIFYPDVSGSENTPNFNFLSFGHGVGSGGALFSSQYTSLLTTLASFGFVVVAPRSCPNEFCPKFYRDLLSVIITSHTKPDLHPGLQNANFSSIGILGHNMGGYMAGSAVASLFLPIRAYIGLHGSPMVLADSITIPIMYTSGGDDVIESPSVTKQSFQAAKNAHPRIFAELSDATHFEPVTPGNMRLNFYAAQFMLCHVSGQQEGCDLIYNKENPESICNKYSSKFVPPGGECTIVL